MQLIICILIFITALVRAAMCAPQDAAMWSATLLLMSFVFSAAMYAKNSRK